MKTFWIAGTIIVSIVTIVILTNGFGLFSPTITGSATALEQVKIPLSEISQTAKWYEYDSNGVKIKFFVVKASDGNIKTGFDACDICYKFKKGYRQEGDYLVCNNCGKRFAINDLGSENKNPGGCWPGYLPNYVDGSNLVIQKSDLENGRWKFA